MNESKTKKVPEGVWAGESVKHTDWDRRENEWMNENGGMD